MEILRKFIKHLLYLSIALFALFAFSGAASAAAVTPTITSATFKATVDKLLIRFNEPVFSANTGTGALELTDFTFTDGNTAGMQNFTGAAVTHTAGNNWAVIEFADAQAAAAGDTNDFIEAKPGAIFTTGGALDTRRVALTQDSTGGQFAATMLTRTSTQQELLITFSEPVFTVNYGSPVNVFTNAGVQNSDFSYTNVEIQGDPTTISAIGALSSGNRDKVVLTLDAVLNAAAIDGNTDDTINIAVDAIYDAFGNNVAPAGAAVMLGAAGTVSDSTAPAVTRIETVMDKSIILVQFNEPVFNSNAGATALVIDNTDFIYNNVSAGGATALAGVAQSHVLGNDWIMLTTTGTVAAGDYGATPDTIEVESAGAIMSVYDAFGNGYGTAGPAVELNDLTRPVLRSVEINNTGSPAKNTLTLTFSEDVTFTGSPSEGASQASTTSVGDMTTACVVAGLGTMNGNSGDVTYATLSNTVAKSTEATGGDVYTISFAGQSYSASLTPVRTAGSVACADGTDDRFYITAGITISDLDNTPWSVETGTAGVTTGANTLITQLVAWDVTAPTTITGFAPTSATTTTANVGWTAGAHADHDTYMLAYRTTTGVSLTNGTLWHKVSDATLATLATTTTQITGLNSGTVYYVTLYAIDTEGNYSTAATEINIQTNSGTARDRTAPSAPTSVKAESKDGKAVLTWTDSTASDLKEIVVLRGKNEFPVSGTPYAVVTKGVKTYTDNDVAAGNTVKYILRARDTSNNESVNSSEVSVVITAPTPAAPETPATPPAEEVTPPPAEEEPVVTPPVEKTAEEIAKEKKIEDLEKKIGKLETAIKKSKAKIAKTKAKGKLKTYKKQLQTYQKQLKAYKKALEKLQG